MLQRGLIDYDAFKVWLLCWEWSHRLGLGQCCCRDRGLHLVLTSCGVLLPSDDICHLREERNSMNPQRFDITFLARSNDALQHLEYVSSKRNKGVRTRMNYTPFHIVIGTGQNSNSARSWAASWTITAVFVSSGLGWFKYLCSCRKKTTLQMCYGVSLMETNSPSMGYRTSCFRVVNVNCCTDRRWAQYPEDAERE